MATDPSFSRDDGSDPLAPGGKPSDRPFTEGEDEIQTGDDTLAAERTEPGTESLSVRLEEAEQRALRLQAELENFRKRVRRDTQEERRYAALPLMRDLLPVVDNLQRAVDAADAHGSDSGLHQGVQLVVSQLLTVLQNHHCLQIDAAGTQFDPSVHEAISQQASDDQPAGTVLEVAQTGYRLHDRVIRPSQVVVSTGTSPGPTDASQ
jgi:molecular chaperone GrpE